VSNEASNIESDLKPCWANSINAFIAALILSVAVGAYLVQAQNSPEFYRHLTIGNWISANDSLPVVDHWTIAGEGVAWSSPSWLFEYGLSSVEGMFDGKSFLLLKIIFLCLFVCSLSLLFSLASNSIFLGTLLAVVASCGALQDISLVPKLVALLCLVLLLIMSTLELSWLVIGTSFFIAALLANISVWHLFIILLVLVTAYEKNASRNKLFCGVLLVSFFVTPYFGTQLKQIISQLINELPFRTSFLAEPASVYQYDSVFVFLLGLVFAVLCFSSKELVSKRDIVISGIALIFSLASSIFNPFTLVVLGLVISRQWGRACDSNELSSLGNIAEGLLRLRLWLQRFDFAPAVFFFSALAVVNVVGAYRLPAETYNVPELAVDALLESNPSGNILHSMEIGDYLVRRFSSREGAPQMKALVDGRTGVLNPEIFQASVLHSKLLDGGLGLENWADASHLICNSLEATCQRYLHDASWGLQFPEDRKKIFGSWLWMRRLSQ